MKHVVLIKLEDILMVITVLKELYARHVMNKVVRYLKGI